MPLPMGLPRLWWASEGEWKTLDGRWDCWTIWSLKKQVNPGALGKFLIPFLIAQVESRHVVDVGEGEGCTATQ